MALTIDLLKAIMPRMANNPKTCAALFPHLVKAMDEANINTPLRIAAFLAQTGHESGEFKYMEELWGPTEQQLKYEPPTPLSKRLGNTQPGDGYLFRGAGALQLTGRGNFREYGQALGVNLEANPDLARTPENGFRIAARYFTKHNLNAFADLGTQEGFDKITLKINGGYTGKPDRDTRWLKARKVLGC